MSKNYNLSHIPFQSYRSRQKRDVYLPNWEIFLAIYGKALAQKRGLFRLLHVAGCFGWLVTSRAGSHFQERREAINFDNLKNGAMKKDGDWKMFRLGEDAEKLNGKSQRHFSSGATLRCSFLHCHATKSTLAWLVIRKLHRAQKWKILKRVSWKK